MADKNRYLPEAGMPPVVDKYKAALDEAILHTQAALDGKLASGEYRTAQITGISFDEQDHIVIEVLAYADYDIHDMVFDMRATTFTYPALEGTAS